MSNLDSYSDVFDSMNKDNKILRNKLRNPVANYVYSLIKIHAPVHAVSYYWDEEKMYTNNLPSAEVIMRLIELDENLTEPLFIPNEMRLYTSYVNRTGVTLQ